jgi:hypothetical protein
VRRQQRAVPRFFENVLAVLAVAQVQVAQDDVEALAFEQRDGVAGIRRHDDALGAGAADDVAQYRAHALEILDDQDIAAREIGRRLSARRCLKATPD